ncbi:hypothetical protein UlMin_012667 [Ulmus minor]
MFRKKEVDSVERSGVRQQQLERKLSTFDLAAIGVGATVGVGVYILVGTVARDHVGPALTLSFLIAGLSIGLSAFCYAKLASRCPSIGGAYAYICIGEGIAWLLGWSLIFKYTIGDASYCSWDISKFGIALFFGGEENMPSFLARHTILELGGVVIDPCAAILVIIATVLLALLFIVIAGGYLGFKNGWVGYEMKSGYFPFGMNGMFDGSAIVFFPYIGFNSVTSTAEEVINPQRDLPLGMGRTMSVCCILYMLVSAVIVGLVPYYALDLNTPISSAFSSYGLKWPVYIITTGAVTALCTSLLGSTRVNWLRAILIIRWVQYDDPSFRVQRHSPSEMAQGHSPTLMGSTTRPMVPQIALRLIRLQAKTQKNTTLRRENRTLQERLSAVEVTPHQPRDPRFWVQVLPMPPLYTPDQGAFRGSLPRPTAS